MVILIISAQLRSDKVADDSICNFSCFFFDNSHSSRVTASAFSVELLFAVAFLFHGVAAFWLLSRNMPRALMLCRVPLLRADVVFVGNHGWPSFSFGGLLKFVPPLCVSARLLSSGPRPAPSCVLSVR